LLFVRFEAGRKTATIQPGPAGVFEIDSDSKLRPLVPESRDAMVVDMRSYFENKLDLLRAYALARGDPTQ
jgi:hypothetical protein